MSGPACRSRFLVLACCFFASAITLWSQATVSVHVRFGLLDTAATSWDGSAKVVNGELLRVRDWRPRPENSVDLQGSWELSTHRNINYNWRPFENLPDRAVMPYFWTPGVVLDIRARAGSEVCIETAQGDFAFAVRDTRLAEPRQFLGGAVVVERVPTVEKLTTDAFEDDFPAILGGSGGEVHVARLAYRDEANEILTRRFDGTSWGSAETVTEAPGDIHLVQIGRAVDGAVWFVWSHQADGNFDLYGRALREGSWAPTVRLTEAPQPDVLPNLASATDGSLWLVWQGFRGGQADIFTRRHDGDGWDPEQRVSESPANDGEPVVAAGRQGEVHIAWDSYAGGDYDVLLRTWDGERWGGVGPIASTPLFEAHVSLTVDAQNRLWAAWNESGLNWGKDTGFLPPVEGTRLYG